MLNKIKFLTKLFISKEFFLLKHQLILISAGFVFNQLLNLLASNSEYNLPILVRSVYLKGKKYHLLSLTDIFIFYKKIKVNNYIELFYYFLLFKNTNFFTDNQGSPLII